MTTRLKIELPRNVAGQKHATDRLIKTFQAHWAAPIRDKPLILHIVGPTGTGKSESVKIISQAMFEKTTENGEGVGLLSLEGSTYRCENKNVDDNIRIMRTQIAAQLRKCPHSLIVMDEFQFANPLALDGILDIWDKPSFRFAGTTIDARGAVFLLVSDLASHDMFEALAQSPRGDDPAWVGEQIASMISALTIEIFRSEKRAALIDHVVPFRPFKDEDREQVAIVHLRRMSSLTVVSRYKICRIEYSEAEMKRVIVEMSPPNQGGRGIAKSVSDIVESMVYFLEENDLGASNAADRGEIVVSVSARKDPDSPNVHGFEFDFEYRLCESSSGDKEL